SDRPAGRFDYRLFGLIGFAVLVVYRKELMRQRQALPYLGAAGILFVRMVVLDVLTNKQDILARFFGQQNAHSLRQWLAGAEDSVKLYAAAFFFLAFCSVLQKTRAERAPAPQVSGS